MLQHGVRAVKHHRKIAKCYVKRIIGQKEIDERIQLPIMTVDSHMTY